MKRFLISLIVFSAIGAKSQISRESDTVYRYFEGIKEPPASWKDSSFDASTWKTSPMRMGSNGYGMPQTMVVTKEVPSLYMRLSFTLPDYKRVPDLALLSTFEGGYVAYINGKEVARQNMGKPGSSTTFYQRADRKHEIITFDDWMEYAPLSGVFLDSSQLKGIIHPGKNVLSFEIHNDSIAGRDLRGFASIAHVPDNINFYNNCWRTIRQVSLDSSAIPVISIDTRGVGIISDTGNVKATMTVFDNKNGRYNIPGDKKSGKTYNIGIRIRGNSSSGWAKKNYRLETQDAAGNNLDVPLLGMNAENDWVLGGPFIDRSQIRNSLAYSLGRRIMEDWSPDTKFCELIIDGQFLGLYQVTELIKRDSLRVNIKKLKTTDIAGNNLTGGYIFKYDQNGFEYVYPKTTDINKAPQQKKYIRSVYNNYYEKSLSDTYLFEANAFERLFDTRSYIDYTIINETMKNPDAYALSMYFYKDRDDINSALKFGPIWDFDLALGINPFQNGITVNGWQYMEPKCMNMFQQFIFRDTSMVLKFRERWQELRKTVLDKSNLEKRIDSLVQYLEAPTARNYQVWPLEGRNITLWGYVRNTTTYKEELIELKSFLNKRIDWIDANIAIMHYEMPKPPKTTVPGIDDENIIMAYPNPCKDKLYLSSPSSKGSFDVEISTLQGQIVYTRTCSNTTNDITEINTRNFAPGVYFVTVNEQGEIPKKKMFVKD